MLRGTSFFINYYFDAYAVGGQFSANMKIVIYVIYRSYCNNFNDTCSIFKVTLNKYLLTKVN